MVDLGKIVKKLKKDSPSVRVGSDLPDKYIMVSTGNLALDLALDGGIPFGCVSEFLGLSQSGKSTMIQKIIANAQKEYDAIGIHIAG